MPFVVDYTPVDALGSLAISAGSAAGEAASRVAQQQYTQRRDLAVLDHILRQRESNQQFGQQQELQSAQFRQQKELQAPKVALDQQALAQRAASEQARLQAAANQPSAAQEAAAVEEARLGVREQAQQRERVQERAQFDQWAQTQGLNQQEAEQAWADYLGRKNQYVPKPTSQSTTLRRPGGQIENAAFELAMSGDFKTIENQLKNYKEIKPGEARFDTFEYRDEIEFRVRGAQLAAIRQMNAAQLQQVLSDPSVPPIIKSEAMDRLAATRNDPSGTAPAGGASEMTDQELYNVFGQ